MYRHVEYYPGDPILSLVETFKRDERPEKVNLSIGIYFDDEGKMPVLESVRRAEAERAAVPRPSPYLPMEGLDTYRSAVQRLLFGQDNPALAEGRVATVQTLGGSGALKVGADFLHRWFPDAKAYVSDPTWDNHKGIFEGAGFEVGTYPYYNPETVGVKFEEMTAFFKTLPENSVLILHPCCQNPTGVDMSKAQWDEVLDIIKTHKLIPFMDIAYQGFGEDLDNDAYAIRKAVEMGLPLFVSNSFSKNLSLYGERVGGLSVVCPNKEEAELVFGQLKFTVRRIYSSPAAHGAYIASDVMNSEELRALWENEVYAMRDRIRAMRQKLYDVLTDKIPNRDFSYFIKQRGMFSYTGLTVEQVHRLRDEFAVYLLDSGRMCVAGLNASNIDYVAEAFAKVLQ
ncbi:TPA: aromatic amino acid transaminase [Neisseria subflava]